MQEKEPEQAEPAVDAEAVEEVEPRPADSERERSDTDQYKHEPEALVVREDDPQDVFRVMDLADENMILDELQGRALAVMVYSFTSGGARQTGLTYWGVAEAVRTLNVRSSSRIRINPEMLDKEVVDIDGKAHHRVTVYAEDTEAGGGQFGAAEVPLKMKLRKGGEVDDPFAYRKALSKAQRNALRSLVPMTFQEAIIAQYLGDETKVRRLRSGGLEPKQIDMPPALADEQAIELQADARRAYDDLKKLNRTRVLPAEFNEWMLRSQHSHDRIRDLIGHMEQLVEEERQAETKAEQARREELQDG